MGYLNINLFAVLVSGIVIFAIGALRCSPLLFGKQWLALNEVTPEKVDATRKGAAKLYGLSFVCYLVMAAAFAMLLRITHITAIVAGPNWACSCGWGSSPPWASPPTCTPGSLTRLACWMRATSPCIWWSWA